MSDTTTTRYVITGLHGALEYRPTAELILVHHVKCWSGCGLVAAGPTCLGGPSKLINRAVHIGVPTALNTDAALMTEMNPAEIRLALADLYARVMPDPDAVLAVPEELPPPVDPGLAERLRTTPCYGPL